MGLFSYLYSLVLEYRRFCFSYLTKPQKLPAKVISIGNLTLGGTGKTPAVISISREAKKQDFTPCILTRGYKGKTKDTLFVSKGETPLLSPKEAGDEPFLMANTLKGIPVVKGKDRYKAGLFALDYLNTPYSKHQTIKSKLLTPDSKFLFILDDGFQHWALQRDVDVVLIDSTNPFGNERLFPEGILREPLSALKRADIIILTKSDMVGDQTVTGLIQKIKEYNAEAPIYTAYYRPTGLTNAEDKKVALDFISGKKIFAFAGIGNNLYFQYLLRTYGAEIADFMSFRDHHSYSQREVDKIKNDALGLDIITTEKDMVKLKGLRLPENLYSLRIEFYINSNFYNTVFRRLK